MYEKNGWHLFKDPPCCLYEWHTFFNIMEIFVFVNTIIIPKREKRLMNAKKMAVKNVLKFTDWDKIRLL